MPRAAKDDGGDVVAAAGSGDMEGVVCDGLGGGAGGKADAENEGGPEHLVSFEALMSWPDVQVLCDVM